MISNTLLEAFSKGIAVLASTDVVYEFGKHTEFPGIILSSYSPIDIAEGLSNIFSDHEVLCRYFLTSLDLAKNFTWENNASMFIEQVKKVLHLKEVKV